MARSRPAQSTRPASSASPSSASPSSAPPSSASSSTPASSRPAPSDRGTDRPGQADRPQLVSAPLFGVVLLASLVIIGAGLRSISSVVAPIFLVLTLVITVAPLRRWLVQRRVPSWLASVLSLLAIYVLLAVILGSVVWSVARLVDQLPQYATAFQKIFSSLLQVAERFGYGEEQLRGIIAGFDLSSFGGVAQRLLSGITGGASLLLLVLTVVVFLAFDAASMPRRLGLIREVRPLIARGLSEFAIRVRKYWVVTTVFGLMVAILDVVALLIIGVPLALTWGVLAFVTNYIPNIGFVLGLLPPALLAVLDGGVGAMLAVVIVYTVVNVVVQTLIQPRVTGDAVGISATVAFISLIFWAYLLGALGALLAVPATLFVKTLLVDHSDTGRWFSALLDAAPKQERVRRTRPTAG